jgi:hypothetical protein
MQAQLTDARKAVRFHRDAATVSRQLARATVDRRHRYYYNRDARSHDHYADAIEALMQGREV